MAARCLIGQYSGTSGRTGLLLRPSFKLASRTLSAMASSSCRSAGLRGEPSESTLLAISGEVYPGRSCSRVRGSKSVSLRRVGLGTPYCEILCANAMSSSPATRLSATPMRVL